MAGPDAWLPGPVSTSRGWAGSRFRRELRDELDSLKQRIASKSLDEQQAADPRRQQAAGAVLAVLGEQAASTVGMMKDVAEGLGGFRPPLYELLEAAEEYTSRRAACLQYNERDAERGPRSAALVASRDQAMDRARHAMLASAEACRNHDGGEVCDEAAAVAAAAAANEQAAQMMAAAAAAEEEEEVEAAVEATEEEEEEEEEEGEPDMSDLMARIAAQNEEMDRENAVRELSLT
jgi:hypothetical protein